MSLKNSCYTSPRDGFILESDERPSWSSGTNYWDIGIRGSINYAIKNLPFLALTSWCCQQIWYTFQMFLFIPSCSVGLAVRDSWVIPLVAEMFRSCENSFRSFQGPDLQVQSLLSLEGKKAIKSITGCSVGRRAPYFSTYCDHIMWIQKRAFF